jgi:spore coat polysaccharide biosynthesis protein SpsF
MKKIIIVIQARLTSSRLPEKVLKKIAGKTLLEIMYLRLFILKKKYQIIFAIPSNAKNLKLKKFLIKKKIPFGVGPEKNVLKRIYNICLKINPEIIIRLTCDCPLIDSSILHSMIKKFKQKKKFDYMSNTILAKKKFPDGLDIEIFKFTALEKAYQYSKSVYEKEHVTPYIQNNLKICTYESAKDYSHKRWTVDTLEDFNYIKNILLKFKYNFKVSFKELIKKNF